MYKKFLWLSIFSIAMGFVEAAVVIYLRKIYYPGGFHFPLVPIEPSIGLTEFIREAATLLMLLAMGMLTGKDTLQRFAIFIFCFATWDIFYYLFLELFIGWPQSLFSWDILFIIPVPWVSPVLAPVIVSLTMIFLAFSITFFQGKGQNIYLKPAEWILLFIGSMVITWSFISNFLTYCSSMKNSIMLPGKDILFNGIKTYVPSSFNWWIFMAGEALLIAVTLSFIKRSRNSSKL